MEPFDRIVGCTYLAPPWRDQIEMWEHRAGCDMEHMIFFHHARRVVEWQQQIAHWKRQRVPGYVGAHIARPVTSFLCLCIPELDPVVIIDE